MVAEILTFPGCSTQMLDAQKLVCGAGVSASTVMPNIAQSKRNQLRGDAIAKKVEERRPELKTLPLAIASDEEKLRHARDEHTRGVLETQIKQKEEQLAKVEQGVRRDKLTALTDKRTGIKDNSDDTNIRFKTNSYALNFLSPTEKQFADEMMATTDVTAEDDMVRQIIATKSIANVLGGTTQNVQTAAPRA